MFSTVYVEYADGSAGTFRATDTGVEGEWVGRRALSPAPPGLAARREAGPPGRRGREEAGPPDRAAAGRLRPGESPGRGERAVLYSA